MKHSKHIMRLVLTLMVLSLSAASSVHEVLPHHHNRASDRLQVSTASLHTAQCEFCAQGPTTSVEATTQQVLQFSHAEIVAPDEALILIPRLHLFALALRGPPTA